jgi:hypothetical protein
MSDQGEQIKVTFEELKRGVQSLQDAARRGDTKEVEDGLAACLASVRELEAAVLAALADDQT